MASMTLSKLKNGTPVSREMSDSISIRLTVLLWLQGLYFLGTGVWPLVSIDTFQMVTGKKTDHLVTGREADHWLVMTVGVLVTSIALTLLAAAWRRRHSPEVVILAVTSALGLAGIDVLYVFRQAIPPIYLADAAIEIILLATWAILLVRRRGERREVGA